MNIWVLFGCISCFKDLTIKILLLYEGRSSQTGTFEFIKKKNKFQGVETAFIFRHTSLSEK